MPVKTIWRKRAVWFCTITSRLKIYLGNLLMVIIILYYLQLIFSLNLHQPHYTNYQENHHIWIKMATSKRLFTVQCPHGPGGVFFAWQRASGGYLATTGYDQIVNIYNRYDSFLFIFVIVWIFEDIDISRIKIFNMPS